MFSLLINAYLDSQQKEIPTLINPICGFENFHICNADSFNVTSACSHDSKINNSRIKCEELHVPIIFKSIFDKMKLLLYFLLLEKVKRKVLDFASRKEMKKNKITIYFHFDFYIIDSA